MSDSREVFIDHLATEMPPVPTTGELAAVRAQAIALANERRPTRAPRWRLAGSVVAVAMVLLAALAILPRLQTAAFAREQAADALLLQTDGKVLHVVLHFTSTSWNEEFGHDSRYDLDQRWSFWIDPTRERVREQYVNLADGSLDGLTVRADDRLVVFQNNVRFGTGDKPQLIETAVPGEPLATPMGPIIDYLRGGIEDGTAKVTGTTTIGGEEYWVVELEEPKDPAVDGTSVITATMRKSDYRLKTWKRESKYHNGNGDGTGSERIEFEVTEQLDPSSFPAEFFSPDSLIDASGPGITLEKR